MLVRRSFCFLNITSFYVLAATPLAFQNNFLLRFCCYALGFLTLLPTTFLLLRSGFSNITSDHVSAASLLVFHHIFVLLCLLLLSSWLSTSYYVLAAALLVFERSCLLLLRPWFSNITSLLPTFLLLRSWLSNTTSDYVPAATLVAFQNSSLLVLAAKLWVFQHNFRLHFCCYAIGFGP